MSIFSTEVPKPYLACLDPPIDVLADVRSVVPFEELLRGFEVQKAGEKAQVV